MIATRLQKLGACEEAIALVGKRKALKTTWETYPRGDHLLWLAVKLNVDRKLIVLAACDCARLALKYVPKGEERPRVAIETTERWCRGEATIEEVRKARNAAAYAAYAAADAAAYAAAADAARSRTQKQCADLVRKRIPFKVMHSAWKATVQS